MRILKIAYIAVLALFLSSCTSHTYYTKPDLVGKIYDAETKKPLSNKKGYIAFFLSDDEDNYLVTDVNGSFKLEPISDSYYFIKPKLDRITTGSPDVYVMFDGFEPKTIDYNAVGKILDAAPNPGAKRPEKVDVGIIYLEPEK